MSTPILPEYTAPYKPVPQVTPFTYRDGVTMLKKLDGIINYMNKTLVPFVNENYSDLADAFETQVNILIQQVNEAIDAVINDSIEVQDPVVAALIADVDSASRIQINNLLATVVNEKSTDEGVFTIYGETPTFQPVGVNPESLFPPRVEDRLASQFEAVGTAYTKSEADSLFETGADANTAHTQLGTSISGVSSRVSVVEELVSVGRLSKNVLDLTYLKIPPQPHAVFIGSSNSTPGTWVDQFVAEMGYVGHNYSIGGGSFTGAVGGSFETQVNNAIADTSYDHNLVKYFFVCDAGNDIRATADVQVKAATVYALITNNFVNAEIIVLPAVWGNATDNNIGGRIISIDLRYQELLNAALGYDVDVIDATWLWLADNGNWMKPGEVHPNSAGYSRIANFMALHMRGKNTLYNTGFRAITAKPAINASLSYWTAGRDRNLVTIQNNFYLGSAVPVDTELGQLSYGLWPIAEIQVPVVASDRSATKGTVIIYPNGLIRSWSGIPADSYNLPVTYRAF